MKKRIFFSALFLTFAIEIAALFFFAAWDISDGQNAVMVNEAVQSVKNDWETIENHSNHTSLDYVVVATDPLKKEVMRLSKPGSKALSVINQETAMRNFKANKYQGQRLFILSRNFQVLSSLRELGYTLPEINIGMYYSKQPDRILTRRIVLSHEDTEIIRSLLRDNCCFKAQYVPSDEAVKLNGLLETL